ncbi:MAG: hypothetical protein JNL62_09940, partial [Bryobacterales bacterium]|nr:hypothetical protein [Bryobacterales bacterium]
GYSERALQSRHLGRIRDQLRRQNTQFLDSRCLELDEALKRLASSHPRAGELIEMRFFGGMSVEECATALNISAITVRRQLRFGQAWLQRELEKSAAR